MNKKKKLNKIKNNLIPRLYGVESWKMKNDLLSLYLLNFEIMIHFRTNRYLITIIKSHIFPNMRSKSIIIQQYCKNSTEITKCIKNELKKDKDYILATRQDKLKRIMYE